MHPVRRLASALLLAASLPAGVLHAWERPQPMVDAKPVTVETSLFATKYRQDGALLNLWSMYPVLERQAASREDAASSRRWSYGAMVLGGVGGFMMGFPAGQALGGKDFNTPMFLAGLGTAAVSTVMGKVSTGRLRRAVDAYNGSVGKTGLDLRLAPGGAGLALAWDLP